MIALTKIRSKSPPAWHHVTVLTEDTDLSDMMYVEKISSKPSRYFCWWQTKSSKGERLHTHFEHRELPAAKLLDCFLRSNNISINLMRPQ